MKKIPKRKVISTKLPRDNGEYVMHTFEGERGQELIVISSKKVNPDKFVTVRLHSECIDGDLFGSKRCDCGEQLSIALQLIQESKNGLLVYHRQEGRNYGLFAKMSKYALIDNKETNKQGWSIVENDKDLRTYDELDLVIKHFGLKSIKLLTDNPKKMEMFEKRGVKTERLPMNVKPNKFNKKGITLKKKKLGYLT